MDTKDKKTTGSKITVTRNPSGEATEVVAQLCFVRVQRMGDDLVTVGISDTAGRVAILVLTASADSGKLFMELFSDSARNETTASAAKPMEGTKKQ